MMASKELVKDFGLPNPLDNNAASRIVPDMTLNKVTLTLIVRTAVAERGCTAAGERYRPF